MYNKLENVINFLKENKYDKETLHEDILSVVNLYHSQCDPVVFNELIDLYNQLLDVRMGEAVNFLNSVINIKGNIFYNYVNDYVKLPFRNSIDPIAEQLLLESMNNIDNLSYENCIYSLINMYDSNLLVLGNNFDILSNTLFDFGINFDSLKVLPKVGNIIPYPKEDNEIITNFLNIRHYDRNSILYKDRLGKYAEYLAYNYFQTKLLDSQNLVWVSRTLGDGFGYDIGIYNKVTKFYDMYEVKGRYNSDNPISLTDHENNIKKVSYSTNNSRYHILKVDIKDINPYFIDIIENSNNEIEYAKDQYNNDYNVIIGHEEDEKGNIRKIYKL